MAWIDEGFSTIVQFSNAPSGIILYMQEKEVTPPAIEMGGELDTTTLGNIEWHTKSPKKLKMLGDTSMICRYDAAIYAQILTMIGVNTLVSITFPDTSTYQFRGWIDKFKPNVIVEGAMATANVIIVAANETAAGVETAPDYTAGDGVGPPEGPNQDFPYGIQGPQGDQGPTSERGFQGVQGEQGVQGTQGVKGDQGVSGAAGSTGATGAQGSQGVTGAQGDAGVTGNQGDQGTAGSTGVTGDQGSQGVTGAQGTQGATGATGATGVEYQGVWSSITEYIGGTDLVSSGGTTYVCILTHTNQEPPNATYWDVFAVQGAQGSQGVQGTTGAQGNQGAAGATGSQGATGAQGSQGVAGAQGSTGTQGSQGAAGATGSTGAQGSQGAQGLLGDTLATEVTIVAGGNFQTGENRSISLVPEGIIAMTGDAPWGLVGTELNGGSGHKVGTVGNGGSGRPVGKGELFRMNNTGSGYPLEMMSAQAAVGDIKLVNRVVDPTTGVIGVICVVNSIPRKCTSALPDWEDL